MSNYNPEVPRFSKMTGHALLYEGRAVEATEGGDVVLAYGRPQAGRAACQCGEWSDVLPSTRQRQEWHREHKRRLFASGGRSRGA